MENKVLVVTGTTSGIGKALALDIAKTGEALTGISSSKGIMPVNDPQF